MIVGATEEHAFKDGEVPFYEPTLDPSKCDGKLIGKREMCYRRGLWKEGMTENGTTKAKDIAAVQREQPSKWQANDIVVRNEPAEDGDGRVHILYKVVEVPVSHTNRSSSDDVIRCQWLAQTDQEGGGAMSFKLTPQVYTFTADTLVWVKPSAVSVVGGKITNKQRCTIEFDMKDYLESEKAAFHDEGNAPAAAAANDDAAKAADAAAADDNDDYFGAGSGDDDDDDDEEDECDMTSLNAVLSRCPSFAEAKSMLEEIVAEAGHLVLLSSKYHCECAGQGIEYCFGRSKWWFRSHNRLSTVNLERNSKAAFGIDVVTIGHVRKFARKCRDYQRVYRGGIKGSKTESKVAEYKTHRAALDTHFQFVTGDVEDANKGAGGEEKA